MSVIRVDNFGPSAGGTTYSARGIAKAWVNFDGTGTIAARDSENVSSLTDNGTGAYTVNFTNAMANANYVIGGITAADTNGFGTLTQSNSVAPLATSFLVRAINNSAFYDSSRVFPSAHGDLA